MIVGVGQQAAHSGLHAENGKEIAADPKHVCLANLAAARQIELLGSPGEDSRESLLLGPNLFPLWIGDLGITGHEAAAAVSEVTDSDDGELLRVLDRKGAQTNSVKKLEDRRIGSDAEGERENRHESEARIEQQEAEAVAGVLKKVLKHRLNTETAER